MKALCLALGASLLLAITPLQAQATDSVVDTSAVAPVEMNTTTSSSDDFYLDVDLGIENVTTEQVTTTVNGKIYEVVAIVQHVAKALAVVGIVVCGLLMLLGIGDRCWLSRGLVGMVIIGVAYLAIMYAPELLDWFVGWLSTPPPGV